VAIVDVGFAIVDAVVADGLFECPACGEEQPPAASIIANATVAIRTRFDIIVALSFGSDCGNVHHAQYRASGPLPLWAANLRIADDDPLRKLRQDWKSKPVRPL
jgi:hypothetical protein